MPWNRTRRRHESGEFGEKILPSNSLIRTLQIEVYPGSGRIPVA
jgi:hypothetical protein